MEMWIIFVEKGFSGSFGCFFIWITILILFPETWITSIFI